MGGRGRVLSISPALLKAGSNRGDSRRGKIRALGDGDKRCRGDKYLSITVAPKMRDITLREKYSVLVTVFV